MGIVILFQYILLEQLNIVKKKNSEGFTEVLSLNQKLIINLIFSIYTIKKFIFKKLLIKLYNINKIIILTFLFFESYYNLMMSCQQLYFILNHYFTELFSKVQKRAGARQNVVKLYVFHCTLATTSFYNRVGPFRTTNENQLFHLVNIYPRCNLSTK